MEHALSDDYEIILEHGRERYRQRPDRRNETVIAALRQALRALEMRAAQEREDFSALIKIAGMDEPETEPVCERCGYVMCRREHGGGR